MVDVELPLRAVLRLPEVVPDAEPLMVPAPLVEDCPVAALCWLDGVELAGGGNVTVADELPPDVPLLDELPRFASDLVEVEGLVVDDWVWLELDCACNASVAAISAAVLALTNFRGIFIM